MAHRLAAGFDGLDTRVVTLAPSAVDAVRARQFDATSGVHTLRVRAPARTPRARNLALDLGAFRHALRFRPDVTLSLHVVASPAAVAVGRALGTPAVQYFHAREIGDKPRLAAFAARHAHTVIAVSAYTAGLVEGTGAAVARMRLISPGVDLPEDPRPLPAERPTVLTIGRMQDRYKGHDVLIRALERVREGVPDLQWVVIGDGPLRPELEAQARARGLARAARFLGAVDDEQRDQWLRRADLLAMPSRASAGGEAGEGFGIVYLEAGAYGKPVVAGNVAGALDAVRDGETGLLVDPQDPTAVAAAIGRLLEDRELARRLGGAGQERARGFAWPVIAQRVEAVLREALGPARRSPVAAGVAPAADP